MINTYHVHTHININPNYPTLAGSHSYILSLFIMKIIELTITMDSLEKESDFYFAKLRDIEILWQYSNISNLPIIDAIQRNLHAAEKDASILIYLVFTMLDCILRENHLQFGLYLLTSLETKWLHVGIFD
ncbi:unnamed protein product [Lactuca virosa]|uniref:EB1 C-terminal domain-containing protein n=1 Tax=Lactuca virosa TaxID=75947 RepID=A0AAU9MQS2_9ASTR|nr:unnamed protein product [Lactuca virosa]